MTTLTEKKILQEAKCKKHISRRVLHSTSTFALLLFLSFTLLFLSACPTYTLLREVQQHSLQKRFEGKLLWLSQSMYVGEFYDDNRYGLIFPRAFDEIPYLRNIEGETLSPPPAKGILPVGTRVRIESVEFPTPQAIFRRPIYTPRYATWITLKVAAGRGDTSLLKNAPHILLIPASLSTEARFSSWMNAALAEEDPNPWLRELPANIRKGVFEKRPVIGMHSRALKAALGPYDRKSSAQLTYQGAPTRAEVALWGKTVVTLVEGIVVNIVTPKPPNEVKPTKTDKSSPNPALPALQNAPDPAKTDKNAPEPALQNEL